MASALTKQDRFSSVSAPATPVAFAGSMPFYFMLGLIAIVGLQKFGLSAGSASLPLGIPLTYALLGFMSYKGLLRINLVRVVLFSLFVLLSGLGLFLRPNFSLPSFLLVSLLALPFVFEAPVTRETFLRCMRVFILFMLATIPIIVLEWVPQFLISPGQWISLDAVFPPMLMIPGFMYYHPTSYGSPYIQPNAAIFLEVSILSQFLALAIMVELAYFKRMGMLATLIITMFVTMGGSGPFMLTLCAPFLLAELPRKLLVPAVVGFLMMLGVLSFTEVFADFTVRLTEFERPGTSSYERFVVPAMLLGEQISTHGRVLLGNGAGSGDEVGAITPLVKLVYEYGWVEAFLFYALIIHMLFKSGQKPIIGWALLVYYTLGGGGLGVAIYGLSLMLLGGLLKIVPTDETSIRSARPRHAFSLGRSVAGA
jgi:hypothetical protein